MLIEETKDTFLELTKLIEPVMDSKQNKIYDMEIINTRKPKVEKFARRTIFTIKKINILTEEYSTHVKESGYFVLTRWPIHLFMMLLYSINLKNISIWPSIVKDEKLLFELDKLVNEEIAKIKLELRKFILKFNNYIKMPQGIESMDNMFILHEDEYIEQMIHDYSIFNMKEEIIEVLNSVNRIKKKDVIYEDQNYLNEMNEISRSLIDSYH